MSHQSIRDDRQSAAPTQHPLDLRHRPAGVEPMECLADEDGIDGRVRQRNRLGCSGEHLAVRDARAHGVVGLDGDDVLEAAARAFVTRPGAGGEVEDRRGESSSSASSRAVEQHPGVLGPHAVVGLGDAAEAQSELSRHRRAGRLGSL